jgi:hypothetical protein
MLAAAALAVAAVPALAPAASVPKANHCGTIATSNGGKAQYIQAYRIGCTTAKAVARRANGRKTYVASGFTCKVSGWTFLCRKDANKRAIVFTYKKPSRA